MAVPKAKNGHPESAVAGRYSQAARKPEQSLCCPVTYRKQYLDAIPEEILKRDYGCGDPTAHVREADTVVDLGSGAGKACYILAQLVGPKGRVIGVDCNADMLALARRYQQEVARRIGYANVEFRCALVQDLALDLERLAEATRGLVLDSPDAWLKLRRIEHRLRAEEPLIATDGAACLDGGDCC